MRSLTQTTVVLHPMVKSVSSSTGVIVPMYEAVGNMVDKAVDEYHIQDVEEASTPLSDDEQ